jgi:hypothetical protein
LLLGKKQEKMEKISWILLVVVPIFLYILTIILFMVLQPVCIQKQEKKEYSILPQNTLDLKKVFSFSSLPVISAILLFVLLL